MSDKMHEGGTGAWSGKQRGYDLVEHYAKRMPRYADGATVHRGDMVAIAGEPGMRMYKVEALHPDRREVQIADTLGRRTWMPCHALICSTKCADEY